VFTPIGLTTVIPTPVPESSCFNPSEKPSIANLVAQYEATPGTPKLAPTDATFTMCPWPCSIICERKFFVQYIIPK